MMRDSRRRSPQAESSRRRHRDRERDRKSSRDQPQVTTGNTTTPAMYSNPAPTARDNATVPIPAPTESFVGSSAWIGTNPNYYTEEPGPIPHSSTRPRTRARAPSSSGSASSSSQFSVVDISRRYDTSRFGGVFNAFFRAPSEHRRKRRVKSRAKKRAVFPFNNSSSSSLNSDLAYGDGYIREKKGTSQRSRTETRDSFQPGKPQRKQTDEEILSIGRQLSDLARAQNDDDLRHSGRSRAGKLASAAAGYATLNELRKDKRDSTRGIGGSKPARKHSDDEDWESASDDDSSDAASALAYGSSRPTMSGVLGGAAAAAAVGAGASWASRNSRRSSSNAVDPRLFGPVNSLNGMVTPLPFAADQHPVDSSYGRRQDEPIYQNTRSSTTEKTPMREVYPVPTSQPDQFDARHSASLPGSRNEVPKISRPGPGPIQAPVPIMPVSSKVYDTERLEEVSRRDSRDLGRERERSSKDTSSTGRMTFGAAATAAMAAAAFKSRSQRGRDEDYRSYAKVLPKRLSRGESIILERRQSDRDAEVARDLERQARYEREREREREKDREHRKSKTSTSSKYKDDKDYKRPSREDDIKGKKADGGRDGDRKSSRHDRDGITVEYDDQPNRDGTSKRSRKDEKKPADRDYTRDITAGAAVAAGAALAGSALASGSSTGPPARPLTPSVFTVDREPTFSDWPPRSPSPDVRLSRRDSFEIETRAEDLARKSSSTRNDYAEEAHAARDVYDEANRATVPVSAAAVAAAIAAESGRDRERRRDEYSDDGSRDRSRPERDAVQEEADRYYRESVIARKIAEDEVRSRSRDKERDGSGRDEDEPEIKIVTPPGYEEEKKLEKSAYDAPDANVRIDNRILPTETERFRTTERSLDAPVWKSRDPSAERDRPLINLVMPTPIPSREPTPAPKRQDEPDAVDKAADIEKPTKADKKDKKKDKKKGKKNKDRSQPSEDPEPLADVVIGPKGDIVQTPSTPKSVSWGENETKSYEIESPEQERKTSGEKDRPRLNKSSKWGILAAAIAGSSTEPDNEPESVLSDSKKSDVESTNGRTRGFDASEEQPPVPGPKPTSEELKNMPGGFGDDIEFAGTLAAGLEDAGFDPKIVVDDPTYRRRDSPPGSDELHENGYYTKGGTRIDDLGPTTGDPMTPGTGFVVGETETPKDEVPDEWAEVPAKLSKKEKRKQEKLASKRQSTKIEEPVVEPVDSPPADDFAEVPVKLSKKEQKKRDKAAKAKALAGDDDWQSAGQGTETPPSWDAGEDEWAESKSKKSKNRKSKDLEGFDTERVSVPVESFSDIQTTQETNPADEWEAPKKSKKKSKSRDSVTDSPSRPASEVASESGSRHKSKRRSLAEDDFGEWGGDPPDRKRIDPFEDRDVSSVVSESRGGSRSKRSSKYDDDDAKSVASAPGGSRKSKDTEKRSSGIFSGLFGKSNGNKDKDDDKKESFLDNAGTLGAGVGLAGAAAVIAAAASRQNATEASSETEQNTADPTEKARNFGLIDPEIAPRVIKPAIDPQYGDLLPLPPSEPGSPKETPEELPELPDSRPDTPPEERGARQQERIAHVRRRSAQETPIKSPSRTAIPIQLRLGARSSQASPGFFKSSPLQSPVTPDSTAPLKRSARPTSWDSSRQPIPLQLVRHARRGSVDAPAQEAGEAPPTSEQAVPQIVLETSAAPIKDPHLRIDTEFPPSMSERELAGSQETTPKAEARPVFPTVDSESISPKQQAVSTAAEATKSTEEAEFESRTAHEDPAPVDPMTKNRSSYLLNSTPPSIKSERSIDLDNVMEPSADSTPSKQRTLGADLSDIPEDLTSADEHFSDAREGHSEDDYFEEARSAISSSLHDESPTATTPTRANFEDPFPQPVVETPNESDQEWAATTTKKKSKKAKKKAAAAAATAAVATATASAFDWDDPESIDDTGASTPIAEPRDPVGTQETVAAEPAPIVLESGEHDIASEIPVMDDADIASAPVQDVVPAGESEFFSAPTKKDKKKKKKDKKQKQIDSDEKPQEPTSATAKLSGDSDLPKETLPGDELHLEEAGEPAKKPTPTYFPSAAGLHSPGKDSVQDGSDTAYFPSVGRVLPVALPLAATAAAAAGLAMRDTEVRDSTGIEEAEIDRHINRDTLAATKDQVSVSETSPEKETIVDSSARNFEGLETQVSEPVFTQVKSEETDTPETTQEGDVTPDAPEPELAEDSWGGSMASKKKGKKNKKGKKTDSPTSDITPADEASAAQAQNETSSDPTQASTPEVMTAPDEVAGSVEPADQTVTTEEAHDSWGSLTTSKKKKGKKAKKNASSLPWDDEPSTTEPEAALIPEPTTAEVTGVENADHLAQTQDSQASEAAAPEETATRSIESGTVPVEQTATEPEPEDEWAALTSSKKKGKKNKKKAASMAWDEPAAEPSDVVPPIQDADEVHMSLEPALSDPIPGGSLAADNEPTATEVTRALPEEGDVLVDPVEQQPEDEWALPKSAKEKKKDKKKKRQALDLPTEAEPEPAATTAPEGDTVEALEAPMAGFASQEPQLGSSEDSEHQKEPVAPVDDLPISAVTNDDGKVSGEPIASGIEPAPEPAIDAAEPEPADDWASASTKKGKKKKKGKQSAAFAWDDEAASSSVTPETQDTPLEETTTTLAAPAEPAFEVPKKGKKGKKKKALSLDPWDDEPSASSPASEAQEAPEAPAQTEVDAAVSQGTGATPVVESTLSHQEETKTTPVEVEVEGRLEADNQKSIDSSERTVDPEAEFVMPKSKKKGKKGRTSIAFDSAWSDEPASTLTPTPVPNEAEEAPYKDPIYDAALTVPSEEPVTAQEQGAVPSDEALQTSDLPLKSQNLELLSSKGAQDDATDLASTGPGLLDYPRDLETPASDALFTVDDLASPLGPGTLPVIPSLADMTGQSITVVDPVEATHESPQALNEIADTQNTANVAEPAEQPAPEADESEFLFPVKKSKKDKKKKKGKAVSEPDFDQEPTETPPPADQASAEQILDAADTQLDATEAFTETSIARAEDERLPMGADDTGSQSVSMALPTDETSSSVEPVNNQPTQADDDFGFALKPSKKDKKNKKKGKKADTSAEDVDATPEASTEPGMAIVPDSRNEETATVAEPEVTAEPANPSLDTTTPGDDEWGVGLSKKDKKKRKKAKATEASDWLSDEQPKDQTDTSAPDKEPLPSQEADTSADWNLPPTSKKDKKKQKKMAALSWDEEPTFEDPVPTSEQPPIVEPSNDVPPESIGNQTASAEQADNDWDAAPLSKKEKKKKKKQAAFSWDDEAVQEQPIEVQAVHSGNAEMGAGSNTVVTQDEPLDDWSVEPTDQKDTELTSVIDESANPEAGVKGTVSVAEPKQKEPSITEPAEDEWALPQQTKKQKKKKSKAAAFAWDETTAFSDPSPADAQQSETPARDLGPAEPAQDSPRVPEEKSSDLINETKTPDEHIDVLTSGMSKKEKKKNKKKKAASYLDWEDQPEEQSSPPQEDEVAQASNKAPEVSAEPQTGWADSSADVPNDDTWEDPAPEIKEEDEDSWDVTVPKKKKKGKKASAEPKAVTEAKVSESESLPSSTTAFVLPVEVAQTIPSTHSPGDEDDDDEWTALVSGTKAKANEFDSLDQTDSAWDKTAPSSTSRNVAINPEEIATVDDLRQVLRGTSDDPAEQMPENAEQPKDIAEKIESHEETSGFDWSAPTTKLSKKDKKKKKKQAQELAWDDTPEANTNVPSISEAIPAELTSVDNGTLEDRPSEPTLPEQLDVETKKESGIATDHLEPVQTEAADIPQLNDSTSIAGPETSAASREVLEAPTSVNEEVPAVDDWAQTKKLSKKDKKKAEKAARLAALVSEESTTVEPELDAEPGPAVEAAAEAEMPATSKEELEVDDWAPKLSKKDKKKAEKAARLAALADDQIPEPAIEPPADPVLESTDQVNRAPDEVHKREVDIASVTNDGQADEISATEPAEDDWAPKMSKKDKKKAEKAARLAALVDSQIPEATDEPPIDPAPEPKEELESSPGNEAAVGNESPAAPTKEELDLPLQAEPVEQAESVEPVVDEWAPKMSKKDKKKAGKAKQLAASLEDETPEAVSATDELLQPSGEKEEHIDDWAPKMSKKDKKKAEKAARLAASLGDEVSPSAPDSTEFVSDPGDSLPVEEQRDVPGEREEPIDEWALPMSKKDKKKAEKAARLAASLDQETFATTPDPAEPAADVSEEPTFAEADKHDVAGAKDEPVDEWSLPMSKKDKKKAEKAARLAASLEEQVSPAAPETVIAAVGLPEESALSEEKGFAVPAGEDESIDDWAPKLSKKDKKKAGKIARLAGLEQDEQLPDVSDDKASPIPEQSPAVQQEAHQDLDKSMTGDEPLKEDAVAEPEPEEWFPKKLSKKDKKKAEKAARQAASQEDEPSSSAPTEAPAEAPTNDPPVQAEDTIVNDNVVADEPLESMSFAEPAIDEWAPKKLSKKDKKKAEKSARQSTLQENDAFLNASAEPAAEASADAVTEKRASQSEDHIITEKSAAADEPLDSLDITEPTIDEWQPKKLSKKDKKRAEKAARLAAPFNDAEVMEDSTTPSEEPAAETATYAADDTQPIDEPLEPVQDDDWAPKPLSKKEKKKAEKAARLGLTSDAQSTEEVLAEEPAQTSHEEVLPFDDWGSAKSAKKKKGKASGDMEPATVKVPQDDITLDVGTEQVFNPSEEPSATASPSEGPASEVDEWQAPKKLSKKEKKKADKLSRVAAVSAGLAAAGAAALVTSSSDSGEPSSSGDRHEDSSNGDDSKFKEDIEFTPAETAVVDDDAWNLPTKKKGKKQSLETDVVPEPLNDQGTAPEAVAADTSKDINIELSASATTTAADEMGGEIDAEFKKNEADLPVQTADIPEAELDEWALPVKKKKDKKSKKKALFESEPSEATVAQEEPAPELAWGHPDDTTQQDVSSFAAPIEDTPDDAWNVSSTSKKKSKKGKKKGSQDVTPMETPRATSPVRDVFALEGDEMGESRDLNQVESQQQPTEDWSSGFSSAKSKKKKKKDRLSASQFLDSVPEPPAEDQEAQSATDRTEQVNSPKMVALESVEVSQEFEAPAAAPQTGAGAAGSYWAADISEDVLPPDDLSLKDGAMTRSLDLHTGDSPGLLTPSEKDRESEKQQSAIVEVDTRDVKSPAQPEGKALAAAAPAAASAGVAVLAEKFGGGKKKKASKKKKIVDKRQPQEDDLFDDPALWESAEKKGLEEEAVPKEVEDFWNAEQTTMNQPQAIKEAVATPPSGSFSGSDSGWKETARQGAPLDAEFEESPILGRGEVDAHRPGPPGLLHSRSDAESSADGLLAEDTQARSLTSDISLQSPDFKRSPSRGLPIVPEVPETEEEHIHDAWASPEINRDSGFITDSPNPYKRRSGTFDDHQEQQRDSGVHTGDWDDLPPQTPASRFEHKLRRSPGSTPRLREPEVPVATPEPEKKRRSKNYGSLTEEAEATPSRSITGVAAAAAGLAAGAAIIPGLRDRDTDPRSVSEGQIQRQERPDASPSPSTTSSNRGDRAVRRVASNTSLVRQRTPEPLKFRPESPGIRSTPTPPLRRVSRRISGELPSSAAASAAIARETNTPKPVANETKVRVRDKDKDMTDVYVCAHSSRPRFPVL